MRWPSPKYEYNVVVTRDIDNHILKIDAQFDRVTSTRATIDIVEKATRPYVVDLSYTFYIGNTDSLLNPLKEANVTQYTLDYIFSIFRTGQIQTTSISPKSIELSNGDITYDPIEKVAGVPLTASGSNVPVDQTGFAIPLQAQGFDQTDSIFL